MSPTYNLIVFLLQPAIIAVVLPACYSLLSSQ